jgi:predicted phosphoadenosine phosphosulfate sulfurtransferase
MAKAELAYKAIRLCAPHHLEKQQALSVFLVLADCTVTAFVLHVPTLAFAVIVENSVVVPEVVIAVLFSGFASEQGFYPDFADS